VALATVVLALLGTTLGHRASRASADPLEPGSGFLITTSISSSATSTDRDALLYPGAPRYLWYTVHNPTAQAITVTSLGVTDVQGPPGCPTSNLDFDDLGLTGAFIVPAGLSATVLAPRPITLLNLPVNQDSCQGAAFTFSFTGTGWYTDTPPGGTKVGTATQLASAPNPSAAGQPVTLTARVVRTAVPVGSSAAAAAVTAGSVSFFQRTPGGRQRLLGTSPVDPLGAAQLSLPTLPRGTGHLLAAYAGTDVFAGSTSALVSHALITPPESCPGPYATSILGTPGTPTITGTAGNDFIYAVDGDNRISAGGGDDCIVVGNGTNEISAGSGADVVLAGHGRNTIRLFGSRNTVVVGDGSTSSITITGTRTGRLPRSTSLNRISLGDGSANTVTVGSGRDNRITLGNGARNQVRASGDANRITIGHGNANRITVSGTANAIVAGHGSSNRITIGGGRANRVTLGNGASNQVRASGDANRITIGHGNANRIAIGSGRGNRVTLGNGARNRVWSRGTRTVVILGSGTGNVVVARPRSSSTCSLPTPPRSWRGPAARYYRDTILWCRVVRR
jgi:hypothetical protein